VGGFLDNNESTKSKNNFQRQTAHIVSVNNVLSGNYIKESGWEPNYIDLGIKISRINLIGIIVENIDEGSFRSMIIDDGTGTIFLRVFDKFLENVNVGEIVKVIGRPREFNEDRFIVPEIIKKTNKIWFNIRKLELEKIKYIIPEKIIKEKIIISPEINNNSTETSEIEESLDENPADSLINLIKSLDSGPGVLFEDIISKSKIPECEKFITKLLELGEIFEVRPGRYKVLE